MFTASLSRFGFVALASGLLGASLFSSPAAAQGSSLMASPAQAQGGPPTIFGVRPQPLGTATLAVETDPTGKKKLKVSNLGSSGCDGFSIAPGGGGSGGIDTLLLSLEAISPSAGNDATVVTEFFGPVNGGPVQKLVTYTSQSSTDPIEGISWHTTADFSSLGAQTLTITGHNFGSQAFKYDDVGSDIGCGTKASAGIIYFTADDGTRICSMGSKPVVVKPAIVNGGGSGPGVGVSAEVSVYDFSPNCPLIPCDFEITSVEMRFTDTEDVSLTGFEQKILGAFATGIDETIVAKSNAVMRVSNLGSSGCDGVSIDPGGPGVLGEQIAEVLLDINVLSSGLPITPGTIIKTEAELEISGKPMAKPVSWEAECIGPGIPDILRVDCGSSTLPLVWEVEGELSGIAVVSADPTTAGFAVDQFFVLLDDIAFSTDTTGAKALSASFTQPTSLYVNGVPHTVDNVRVVIDESDAWRVTHLDRINVQTKDIPEFTIASIPQSSSAFQNLGHLKSNGHVTVLKGPLTGGGTLEQGALGGLMLRDAPPSAPALIFIGLEANPLPFKGGKLVPLPAILQLSLPTSAAGEIDLPFAWPGGIPSAFELVFQYAAQDLQSPEKVWLSNAMRLTTP